MKKPSKKLCRTRFWAQRRVHWLKFGISNFYVREPAIVMHGVFRAIPKKYFWINALMREVRYRNNWQALLISWDHREVTHSQIQSLSRSESATFVEVGSRTQLSFIAMRYVHTTSHQTHSAPSVIMHLQGVVSATSHTIMQMWLRGPIVGHGELPIC